MTLPARPLPKTPAEVEAYVAVLGPELTVQFLLSFGCAEMYIPADPKTRSRVAALESAIQRGVEEGLNGPSMVLDPVCDHRRAHRPGRPGRIDTDSELRAFVLARIERMTFIDLAEDIAKHFPPERRVGKSALNEWCHKNRLKSHPRSSEVCGGLPISNHVNTTTLRPNPVSRLESVIRYNKNEK